MAAGFSKEIFNYREEILASDLNRAQDLIIRDTLDVLRDESRLSDNYLLTANGVPLSGGQFLPLCSAVGGTLNVAIGDGRVFMDFPSGSSDFSNYQVCRWYAQNILFAAGGGADRIDLIVAEPLTADTDNASRNVLVDPTLRTITASNVNKTRNPVATLTRVDGTATAPNPPAVPVGTIALFEVKVPAGAADSALFSFVRRLHRRAPYPFTAMHGILEGCQIEWTDVDENAASSVDSMALQRHRALINGELLDWYGSPDFVDDGAFPPTQSGTEDLPYYYYLCGGQTSPQRTFAGGISAPVIVVRSTRVPLADGHPGGALIGPAGAIPATACLYIGIGWIAAGAAPPLYRKPCRMAGDFVFGMCAPFMENGTGAPLVPGPFPGTTGVVTAVTLNGRPAPSTEVVLAYEVQNMGGAETMTVYHAATNPYAGGSRLATTTTSGAGVLDGTQIRVALPPTAPEINYSIASAPGAGIAGWLRPWAYNMNVRRFGSF